LSAGSNLENPGHNQAADAWLESNQNKTIKVDHSKKSISKLNEILPVLNLVQKYKTILRESAMVDTDTALQKIHEAGEGQEEEVAKNTEYKYRPYFRFRRLNKYLMRCLDKNDELSNNSITTYLSLLLRSPVLEDGVKRCYSSRLRVINDVVNRASQNLFSNAQLVSRLGLDKLYASRRLWLSRMYYAAPTTNRNTVSGRRLIAAQQQLSDYIMPMQCTAGNEHLWLELCIAVTLHDTYINPENEATQVVTKKKTVVGKHRQDSQYHWDTYSSENLIDPANVLLTQDRYDRSQALERGNLHRNDASMKKTLKICRESYDHVSKMFLARERLHQDADTVSSIDRLLALPGYFVANDELRIAEPWKLLSKLLNTLKIPSTTGGELEQFTSTHFKDGQCEFSHVPEKTSIYIFPARIFFLSRSSNTPGLALKYASTFKAVGINFMIQIIEVLRNNKTLRDIICVFESINKIHHNLNFFDSANVAGGAVPAQSAKIALQQSGTFHYGRCSDFKELL
jgi:hypothetical protein